MTEGPAPAVSVVMPVYNSARWVQGAVESIRRQTLASLELIAIDDGSTDGSTQLLEQAADDDRRVRVIRQPHRGIVEAMNRGLAESRAPLLARLDADDLAHDTRLARQAEFLNARPEAGLVGTWAIEIDEAGRVRGRRTPEPDPQALKQLLRRTNPIIHSAVMARTDLLRRLGGYRPAFQTAEDYDLWCRASDVTEIANIPEFLVSYRVHGGGVSCGDPLRQAFSARLTKRSAVARREQGIDPAEALDGPPDWGSEAAVEAFYAADAGLYRWLDGADETRDPVAWAGARSLIDGTCELDHAERRLAAQAIWRRVRSGDRQAAASAREMLIQLCRRQPTTVLKAAWSLAI